MVERVDPASSASFPHLPPAWAWKNAERWLEDLGPSGQPRQKIDLPTDDRGFIKTDEAVEIVKDLFIPSYQWIRDEKNPNTRLDDHHFYFDEEDYKPHNNHGSSIPSEFRELPPNIGTMTREIHCVFHHATNKVAMPEIDAMREFNERYHLAKQAFTNLHIAAEDTLQWHALRLARREDIRKNPWRIGNRTEDTIGEEITGTKFKLHFSAYLSALEEFKVVEHKDVIVPGKKLRLDRVTPQQIIRIGKIVTLRAVDYKPQLAASYI